MSSLTDSVNEHQKKQHVLVLGGGFGGIKVALELAGHPSYLVTLLSDQDSFRYYPQLYHTATGGSHAASQIPLAEIFEGKDVIVIKDSAKKLDRQAKNVVGVSGKKYDYDILVVALGVVTNFFGVKGLDKYAYGIKSLDEARKLREHLHEHIADEGKPDLNYVVIGGGPTGVELAGALPGYLRHIMQRHGIRQKAVHVELVEAAPRLLPRMPKSYSIAVQKQLRRLGVKLYLGETVKAETADSLKFSGHDLKSHTVVWTAGVTNHPFLKANGFRLSEHGKVVVDDYLQAEDTIYVIGDNADTKYSGMAQTALYDAVFVAANLSSLAKGKKPKVYKPRMPVYITPVGPHWAAVLWGKVHLYGWLGWVLRNFADLIAYHDLEPWWMAEKKWQTTYDHEETCPVCANEN